MGRPGLPTSGPLLITADIDWEHLLDLFAEIVVPPYFFHVEDDIDPIGTVLPNVAEAKCEAARFAGRLLCDQATEFWTDASITIRVADESGLTLFALSISGFDAPILQIPPPLPA